MHAYGVVSRLRERGFANVGYGTIYPLVTRLKRQGLVDERTVSGGSGPDRKVLSINSRGRSALRDWTGQWERTSQIVSKVLVGDESDRRGESHGT